MSTETLDCGHAPDKGEPANVNGETVMGWQFVVLDDGRKVCHTCADSIILDCGHKPSPRASFTTGYATTSDGKKICYQCAANADRADMVKTGRATLYLVDSQGSKGYPFSVQNWPGSLTFAVTYSKRNRYGGGFGAQRTDAYFVGPDGKPWHAINRGDNQIVRCKRMKG